MPELFAKLSLVFGVGVRHSLQRDQVAKRLGEFVAAHNREANKHGTGKFGLISIDAPAFVDGATPLVETISLWD